jgi:putative transposase
MPRLARVVFAGLPHHITQRGHRRENVFFSDADRTTYLDWLAQYCAARVQIVAYCLMTNHVHLLAVPESDDGFERSLRTLHSRYAMRVNRWRGSNGYVWQGRYFSSVLDESYFWAALRYVERNPVRAGLVNKAQDYRWSSAAAHCGLRDDALLTRDPRWIEELHSVPDWSGWLAEADRPHHLTELRRQGDRGLPCGSAGFVRGLKDRAGRPVVPRPRGRPKK